MLAEYHPLTRENAVDRREKIADSVVLVAENAVNHPLGRQQACVPLLSDDAVADSNNDAMVFLLFYHNVGKMKREIPTANVIFTCCTKKLLSAQRKL